jgi:hypothetical protein
VDRPRARLFLRKHEGISVWNSFPADAFSAQCPCFLATRLPFGRKGNHKSEEGQDFYSFSKDESPKQSNSLEKGLIAA